MFRLYHIVFYIVTIHIISCDTLCNSPIKQIDISIPQQSVTCKINAKSSKTLHIDYTNTISCCKGLRCADYYCECKPGYTSINTYDYYKPIYYGQYLKCIDNNNLTQYTTITTTTPTYLPLSDSYTTNTPSNYTYYDDNKYNKINAVTITIGLSATFLILVLIFIIIWACKNKCRRRYNLNNRNNLDYDEYLGNYVYPPRQIHNHQHNHGNVLDRTSLEMVVINQPHNNTHDVSPIIIKYKIIGDPSCCITLEPIKHGALYFKCGQCNTICNKASFDVWVRNNPSCPGCRMALTANNITIFLNND